MACDLSKTIKKFTMLNKTVTALLCILWYSGQAQQQQVLLKNNDQYIHTDEQITINRTQLKALDKQFSEGLIPLVTYQGKPVASQADDLNGDGKWDELALVFTVPASSEVTLTVTAKNKEDIPKFKSRAHAFLGKSPQQNNKFNPVKEEILPKSHLPQAQPPLYQMEGPVWENDKGAFRLYFDVRNGKDIFAKSVSDIMMDTIGIGKGNYHAKANWGMDVLKVGESLGAGAVAFILKNQSGEETTHRLGETVKQTKYTLIADGPVRAMIRLDYEGIQMGNAVFNARDEISIWAGSPAYQSKISVSGISEPIKLVTGIVNLYNTNPPVQKTEAKYALLASHAKQSENKDYLGMAVMVPKKHFIKFDEAPKSGAKITHTFETVLSISEKQPAVYEFATAWEGRNPEYANPDYFLKELENYARQRFNPVIIVIK